MSPAAYHPYHLTTAIARHRTFLQTHVASSHNGVVVRCFGRQPVMETHIETSFRGHSNRRNKNKPIGRLCSFSSLVHACTLSTTDFCGVHHRFQPFSTATSQLSLSPRFLFTASLTACISPAQLLPALRPDCRTHPGIPRVYIPTS